jgi:hypothetical protein
MCQCHAFTRKGKSEHGRNEKRGCVNNEAKPIARPVDKQPEGELFPAWHAHHMVELPHCTLALSPARLQMAINGSRSERGTWQRFYQARCVVWLTE